mgnify:CR=1 FL=1
MAYIGYMREGHLSKPQPHKTMKNAFTILATAGAIIIGLGAAFEAGLRVEATAQGVDNNLIQVTLVKAN